MTDTVAPATLPPDAAQRLAEFARSCKAAARAVSLYPGSHPAIGASLGRLVQATGRMTDAGPLKLQVHPDRLLVDGAAAAKPDVAIAELAEVLHRHLIGALTVNAGADESSWRTLLLLLARAPEEIRADGGIAHLWATAGGPSLEITEIDYAEVLRERRGTAADIDRILAAALSGPQLELDDTALRALHDIVGDPATLDQLMQRLQEETEGKGVDAKMGAFLSLLRGLAEYLARTSPEQIETTFRNVGHAAGKLSADDMLALLARQKTPEAVAGGINVVGAVVDRMEDSAVASFVASSVVSERGASERLAHAFQALVPDTDKQRQLLALAEEQVSDTALGQDTMFAELWERVETMLTSYSDEQFVSEAYGRELVNARTKAVDVERVSDDPPERIATWIATVSDTALRALDHQLLLDLLVIEEDSARWRDVAETVVAHAEDLVRVGYFDKAWELTDVIVRESMRETGRQSHGTAVLGRFGRGAMMKQFATHLKVADDAMYERFRKLCEVIGTPVIAPLAEALSAEQDARARRRLRDVLVGFGAKGRESVQQLMNASNWEVRRTAAFLLREFGGSEGLKELIPLLTDSEPLVQREAVQGLVLNGTDEASQILLQGLTAATGATRERLITELLSMRDERAGPAFCYLIKRMDRHKLPQVYFASIEALGTIGGGVEAVSALTVALNQGDWWAPLRTRKLRATAASSLRRIGSPEALDALRSASSQGPRGVRSAARAELARE